jgi:hypothetical protein
MEGKEEINTPRRLIWRMRAQRQIVLLRDAKILEENKNNKLRAPSRYRITTARASALTSCHLVLIHIKYCVATPEYFNPPAK